jgi:hypothetical protein
VPAGATVGAPHYIGVGAQKSGTTWWHARLMAHPQSARTGGKEKHFFDRYWNREFDDADVSEYHRLFPRADGRIVGEWTPDYMFQFWTPALIARAAPDAKILVMLRDPVERYVSGLRQMHDESDPAAARTTLAGDALGRSRYCVQITRLLRSVDRQNLKVLQYERCVRDPEQMYRATLEFIGYDDTTFVPENMRRARGKTSKPKPVLTDLVREQIVADLSDDVRQLANAYADDIDLDLWPNFRR